MLPLQADLVKIMINNRKLFLNARVAQSFRLNMSFRFLKRFGGKWRCREICKLCPHHVCVYLVYLFGARSNLDRY